MFCFLVKGLSEEMPRGSLLQKNETAFKYDRRK